MRAALCDSGSSEPGNKKGHKALHFAKDKVHELLGELFEDGDAANHYGSMPRRTVHR